MISNEQRAHELALQISGMTGNFLIDGAKAQALYSDKKNINIDMDQTIDAYFKAYEIAIDRMDVD